MQNYNVSDKWAQTFISDDTPGGEHFSGRALPPSPHYYISSRAALQCILEQK